MLTTAQPQPNGKPPGAQNRRVHANPALLKGKPLRPVLRPRGFELTLTSPSLPLPSLLPRKSCRLCLRTVGGRPAPIAAGPAAPIPCALGRRDRPARLTSFLLPRFPSAAAFDFNEKRRLWGRQRPDNGGHEATKSASRSLWSLTCHPPLSCSVHPGAATAAPHPEPGTLHGTSGACRLPPRSPPGAPRQSPERPPLLRCSRWLVLF